MLQYYKNLLKDFKNIPGLVIVYGSVAKNKSRPDSDIDIAIFSDNIKSKNMAEEIADKIYLNDKKVVSIFWMNFENLKNRSHEPFIKEVLAGEVINGRKFIRRFSS